MELIPGRSKIKDILWIISILIAYAGLVGFTCFIFEEALQLQSFAAYMYVNSGDWEGLEEHIKMMEKSQNFAEVWIKGIGWSNPIMWPAFLTYLDSNEAYISTLKRMAERENG